jgi:hypothetical protein
MAAEEVRRIHAGAELSVGDEIEAWHNGKLFHRGRVSKTVASTDLVWIQDARTGARRLIDVEALVVLRASAPADASPHSAATAATATATAATARAKAAAGALARPTSPVPLFQAPSLAT